MNPVFSQNPGPFERHLKRRSQNPLFAADLREVSAEQVLAARQKDQIQFSEFMQQFQKVVQQATQLTSNIETEVVLQIKHELDQCYAQCCAFAPNQPELKQAINKLILAIMNAIKKGAANDPVALSELEDEEQARALHFRLHEFPLIADLLLEDSPINDNELTPTILNESAEELDAALQLFDAEQLSIIYQQATNLLSQLRTQGHELPEAWQRLQQIKNALSRATAALGKN